MGAAQRPDIHGAKGGESKPKSPVEAPDSLQSTNLAKILIAVGEGNSTAPLRRATSSSTTHQSKTPVATTTSPT